MNTSVLLAALLLVATPAFAENAPALPRATVEIPALKTSGQTIRVPAGGDLQKALDDAKPGDRIELQPRATYEGPFHLKAKDGDDWIVITTSGELPKPGRHIQPSHAAAMPKLISAGDFLVSTDPGAHHYRFVGIEFAPKAGSFVTTLIQFGDKETSADAVPHHLIVDRCYVHGDAKLGARRGVALNGRNIAVIDSYIADFKEVGADSQAVSGWNGPGPIKIANNYLEAAGENIMFGGADPKIADLVPSDIEVVHNHLSKPLRWRKGVNRAQIDQMAQGSVQNSRAGNLDYQSIAPWIGWGPYLWTRGTVGRSDGLVWTTVDVESDGTHPSQSGEQKVGRLLLDFFKTSPVTQCWFLAGASC